MARAKDLQVSLQVVRTRTVAALEAYQKMIHAVQGNQPAPPRADTLRQDLLLLAREGVANIVSDREFANRADDVAVWGNIRLGEIELELGHSDEAERAFARGLACAEQVSKAEPKRLWPPRDVALCLGKLGDIRGSKGDTAAALGFYQRQVSSLARLAGIDEQNPQALRRLVAAGSRLALTLDSLGRRQEALDAVQQCVGCAKRLAGWNLASNVEQVTEVFTFKLFGIPLQDVDRVQRFARVSGQSTPIPVRDTGVQLIQTLDEDPTEEEVRWDVSNFLRVASVMHVKLGHCAQARALCQSAVDVDRRASAKPQATADCRLDLFLGLYLMAVILQEDLDFDGAANQYGLARAALDEIRVKKWAGPTGVVKNKPADEWVKIISTQVAFCKSATGAINSLDAVLKANADEIAPLAAVRVKWLTRSKDAAGLLATAAAVNDLAPTNPRLYYTSACAWSQAIGLVPDPERKAACVTKAVAALARTPVGPASSFATRADFETHILNDPDLHAVRSDPAFTAFRATLSPGTQPVAREIAPPATKSPVMKRFQSRAWPCLPQPRNV